MPRIRDGIYARPSICACIACRYNILYIILSCAYFRNAFTSSADGREERSGIRGFPASSRFNEALSEVPIVPALSSSPLFFFSLTLAVFLLPFLSLSLSPFFPVFVSRRPMCHWTFRFNLPFGKIPESSGESFRTRAENRSHNFGLIFSPFFSRYTYILFMYTFWNL